jgi:hypothetical protein
LRGDDLRTNAGIIWVPQPRDNANQFATTPRRNPAMYDLIQKQIATDYFQQRFPNDGQRFVA